MKLPEPLGHLTYCLNIHATQTFADVLAALTGPAAEVKASVSPKDAFAIGLRFSGEALAELADPAKRALLKATLDEQNFYVVTVNGFPYGPFHGTRVKEEVYQPDWRSEERVRYTNALADLMAELALRGEKISLSTVPGTFKPLAEGSEAVIAENILRSVAHLIALEARTGVPIALAIEPEPACFLETIADTVEFFSEYLFSADAAARIAGLTGLSSDEAASILPRHLGLCYDVCHAAVEYEDAAGSIAALRKARIPVHKLQLSAALLIPRVTEVVREALTDYVDGMVSSPLTGIAMCQD